MFEQLQDPKFGNLDETNQFFERHNMPKLIEETHDRNKTEKSKEIEPMINNLPNQKLPRPR